jgi:hypothetical protein
MRFHEVNATEMVIREEARATEDEPGELPNDRMSLAEGIDCIVILYPCILKTFLCNVVCRTAS